jgi:hypothetical protein
VSARSGHHLRAIQDVNGFERMSGSGRRGRGGDGERGGPNRADDHMSKTGGEHIDPFVVVVGSNPSVPVLR